MDIITSRDNARRQSTPAHCAIVRSSARQRGCFFAEGPKLCLELAKSCTPRTAYATEAALEKTPALAKLATPR